MTTLNQQQETNQLRVLVNLHLDTWMAAGKFFLPDEHDCLEFIVTEAVEALQAKMRLSTQYVRNNPSEATERDIAIELFDTMMMCLVFERITEKEMPAVNNDEEEQPFKSLHRIIYNASRALVMFDDRSYFEFFDLLVIIANVYRRASTLIKQLGFDPLEIAREKLERKSAKLKACEKI